MTIFKIEKNKYVLNELISWGWNIIFFGVIVLILFNTTSMQREDIYLSALFVFLINLSDTVQKEHVATIKVDTESNKLVFVLSGPLSGKKEKSFPLDLSKAILIKRPKAIIWMYQKLTLKVSLPDNSFFSITQRYGLSENSLKEIKEAINQ